MLQKPGRLGRMQGSSCWLNMVGLGVTVTKGAPTPRLQSIGIASLLSAYLLAIHQISPSLTALKLRVFLKNSFPAILVIFPHPYLLELLIYHWRSRHLPPAKR